MKHRLPKKEKRKKRHWKHWVNALQKVKRSWNWIVWNTNTFTVEMRTKMNQKMNDRARDWKHWNNCFGWCFETQHHFGFFCSAQWDNTWHIVWNEWRWNEVDEWCTDDTIGIEGAVALSEMLKTNTTVKMILLESLWIECDWWLKKAVTIGGCLMTDNKMGDEGTKVLSESLKVNTTLLNLNLFSFWISQHWLMKMTVDESRIDRQWHWTRRCQINFRIIEIEWQSAASHSGQSVIDLIYEEPFENTKEHCWMTDNQIGDEGVKSLSEMLKVNTTLINLYLYSEW